jgi:phospholipid/cholesterol/gamma-HCH transport system permease protein
MPPRSDENTGSAREPRPLRARRLYQTQARLVALDRTESEAAMIHRILARPTSTQASRRTAGAPAPAVWSDVSEDPGAIRDESPGVIASIGASALRVAQEIGGIVLLTGQVVRALIPPRIDGRELWRHLHKMGYRSVPIVMLTALFAGGLMMLQSGPFVKRFGATSLAGWFAGYAVLREIGPILIALMFSGRVGANNTAELSTMTVTEQLDGLRALAIDPVRFLVVPRVIAMVVTLLALTVIGDLVALAGASITARAMLDIEWSTLLHSFADNLRPYDLLHGLYKSIAFGAAIAVSSCYFGVTVRGGAVGVGRAVNAAVVAAAVSIMLLDFFLTYLTG